MRTSPAIAYLVFAHQIDDQLRLLLVTLLDEPQTKIYLHIDAKVEKLDWLSNYGGDRVRVVHKYRINWGGYAMLEATIDLLQLAVADEENTHFVILSGRCFPLKPMLEVNAYIAALKNSVVAVWGKINPALKSAEGLGRFGVTKFHPLNISYINPKRSRLHARVWNVFRAINNRLPYERHVELDNLWKGSLFAILTRQLATACAAPPAELLYSVRYAMAPEEIYIATMYAREEVSNIRPVKITLDSETVQALHYIRKEVPTDRTLREKIFGMIDLRQLYRKDIDIALASGAFFTRKCSLAICTMLSSRLGTTTVAGDRENALKAAGAKATKLSA